MSKQETNKISDYLTIKQASEYLGVHKDTIRRWETKGKIEAKRNPINNYRIYKKEDLDKILEFVGGNI